MRTNKLTYVNVFTIICCILFLAFLIGLHLDPNGVQRQIFFAGMNDFFADFFNVLRYIAERDPYFNPINGYGEKGYLPLTYLILYPFSQLDNYNVMTLQETWNSKMGVMSLFLFIGFSVFMLIFSLKKIVNKYNLSPILLLGLVLSYIFFFSIERGNTIILTASFTGLFLCYYDSIDRTERIIAIMSLALAVTIKVYPVLFGFLYFEKKQYREIFLSAGLTLIFIFIPFLFFKREFANIPQFINNVWLNTEAYSIHRIYPRFNLSHILYRFLIKINISDGIEGIYNISKILTIIASLASVIFSVFIKNKWLKISLLTLTLVFLPVNSALYCGLYIFPMIILFFATINERTKIFNIFILIVFIILLNPFQIGYKNYIFANIALLSLWLVLLIISGKHILIKLIKQRVCKLNKE